MPRDPRRRDAAVIGAPFFLFVLRGPSAGTRCDDRWRTRGRRRDLALGACPRGTGADGPQDVDLEIPAGAWVAIVRPNGAGKSTLLVADRGAGAPGEVTSAGAVAASIGKKFPADRGRADRRACRSRRRSRSRGAGRLPYEDRLRGLRPVDRAAVAAAIDRVGLGRLVGRDVRELSLGERQLVLLAVAIAQAAPVVMLDEPTVHLDIRHQFDVMDLLADLNRRDGRTIVTVLHDLHLAASRIPRIVVVAEVIVADGPPAEARRADRDVSVGRLLPTGPWSPEPAAVVPGG